MTRALTPLAWGVLAVVVAALLFGLAWWANPFDVFHRRQRAETRADTAEAQQTITSAQAAAAEDTVRIIDRGVIRERVIVQTTEANRAAITAAPGADAPLDPGLDLAGRRAVCVRQSAAGDPQCAGLRPADPAVPPG